MIQLITADNRSAFFQDLTLMHRHRKEIFVDRLGWSLPCEEGLEIDEFDSPDALYLLYYDPAGELLASARMLPTNRPHLMSEYFGALCPNGAPSGDAIWESTRFCPSPSVESPAQKRQLLGIMIAGMMEAGLLFGIEQISFVASGALRPVALAAGWSAHPLGPMQRLHNDRITACIADVEPQGLRRVRERHGLRSPLLRYIPARRAA